MPLGMEVGLDLRDIVFDVAKGAQHPLFLAHVYCGHGRPSQLLLSSCFAFISCRSITEFHNILDHLIQLHHFAF